jgi:hypothetical protein
MKKLLFIFLIAATGCTAARNTVERGEWVLKLTVTHVENNGERKEVWAKAGYRIYKADCVGIPDSVKVGTVITSVPCKSKLQCPCVFVRIR